MAVFAFGKFLNVSVAFFSNIREARICQVFSRKGNFPVFGAFND